VPYFFRPNYKIIILLKIIFIAKYFKREFGSRNLLKGEEQIALRRKWQGAPDVAHSAWRIWRGVTGITALSAVALMGTHDESLSASMHSHEFTS
jgi:hypothetical protein